MPLINSLTAGVSALSSFSTDLNVIGNNIANVNTVGYKDSKANFSDSFSNTLRSTLQMGTGVQVSNITQNFNQGSLTTTGVTTDLGVSGNGFFVVQNPVDGQQYVTRAGNFTVDSQGYLITAQGFRVQGLTGSGLGTVGDIQFATPPTGTELQSYAINDKGQLIEYYSDGSSATTNQILLQNFTNPSALKKEGGNLYSNTLSAGAVGGSTLTAANNTADGNGLGSIQSGTLELSNVDLTGEMANMITAQRSFQAASRVITVSDQMLEEIVNLKR